MARARQALLLLGGVLVAVLVVTGTWLWFEYVPPRPGTDEGDGAFQVLHRVATQLLLADVVVLGALHLVDRQARRGWRWCAAALVAALAAVVTGGVLPWDRLALLAVSTGEGYRGIDVYWDAGVALVLSGGRELDPAELRWWAIAHVALLPLAAAAAWAVRRWWRPRRAPDPGCSTTTSRT